MEVSGTGELSDYIFTGGTGIDHNAEEIRKESESSD